MAIGQVCKEVGKKFLCLLAARLILKGGIKIVENNKVHGRTWFGKKKVDQKNTHVDLYGNIVLGQNDYKISR